MKVSDGELLFRTLTHGSESIVRNFTNISGGVRGKVILPNGFAKECAEFFFEWFEELNKENNEA